MTNAVRPLVLDAKRSTATCPRRRAAAQVPARRPGSLVEDPWSNRWPRTSTLVPPSRLSPRIVQRVAREDPPPPIDCISGAAITGLLLPLELLEPLASSAFVPLLVGPTVIGLLADPQRLRRLRHLHRRGPAPSTHSTRQRAKRQRSRLRRVTRVRPLTGACWNPANRRAPRAHEIGSPRSAEPRCRFGLRAATSDRPTVGRGP